MEIFWHRSKKTTHFEQIGFHGGSALGRPGHRDEGH